MGYMLLSFMGASRFTLGALKLSFDSAAQLLITFGDGNGLDPSHTSQSSDRRDLLNE